MTDQPSSHSEPSMEDILASIRRIIDDEDVKTVDHSAGVQAQAEPASSPWPPAQEQVSPYAIQDDAAAEALAEYDSALAQPDAPLAEPDPEEETIFPERGGALWRRVAGHPLSEGETDPLPADDAYELTEAVDASDGDMDELELNELLDDSADSDPEEDERVLAGVAGSLGEQPDPATDESSIGIGAMTAAGIGAAGAAGAFSTGAMDRIAERMSHIADDDDDEVLDLTRRVGADGDIEELASAMSDNPRFEADDLPPPVFERVDVATPVDDDTPEADQPGDDELLLDRSFETVAVTGLTEDYSGSLTGSEDAHERALDERFYTADGYEENAPEIEGSYATSLGGDAAARMDELPESGAPTADELDTVGGLVRDALRSRLPAVPSDAEENPLVTGGAEESVSRSLATLARYDANAPRRIYGGIKITDDEDSPTIEGVVQDTLRPMLRDWLNDNLPTLVESMVKQEVERISARSRRFVKDDED